LQRLRRFEATSLEDALVQVRHELGDDARIVSAEKVRRGGVAGFFAKETYEITVDVDGGGDLADPADADGAAPASILDLADAVSAAEAAPAPSAAPAVMGRAPLSTETRSFAAVLERISAEAADDAVADSASSAPADPARDRLAAVRPKPFVPPVVTRAEPGTPPGPAPGAGPAPDPGTAPGPAPDPGTAPGPSVAPGPAPGPAVASAVPAAAGSFGAASSSASSAVASAPTDLGAALPAAAGSGAAPRVSRAAEPTRPVSATAGAVPAPAVPVPAATLPATIPAAGLPAPARREFGALQALGLPDAYLPEHDDRDLAERLAVALARLPEPPALPVWTGSVVAVVGPRDEALPLARELSTTLGRDPKEIALASPAYRGKQVPQWLQIPTAQVAEEQRRSWRRRSTPTVVVVDVAVGGKHCAWANEVLDALEPSLSWGVVDATRKTVDVAAWSRNIGGVDVLAVRRVDETVAPAEILSLGIPVGKLDDEIATPERWARVLRERLAAA